MPRSPLTVEVKNSVGAPVSGASVAVFARHSGAVATIYNAETGGSTITNPATTDAAGRATFWADRGDYRADVTGTGITPYSIPLNASAAAAGTMVTPWINSGVITPAVSQGKSVIGTQESTVSTTYTTLTTPDQVTGIVLPSAGLIGVMYTAIWTSSISNNARAAIFLGANQLKIVATVAPVVSEAGGTQAPDDDILVSNGAGLVSTPGTGVSTQVTTGETVTQASSSAICWIIAAAGTYTVSVRYKNVAAGTVTAKSRVLRVFSIPFIIG